MRGTVIGLREKVTGRLRRAAAFSRLYARSHEKCKSPPPVMAGLTFALVQAARAPTQRLRNLLTAAWPAL